MLPYIYLFGIKLGTFGLMVAIGVLVSLKLMEREGARRGLPPGTAVTLVVIAVGLGFLMARVHHIVRNFPDFALRHPDWTLAEFLDTFVFARAGFIWYGGFLGGVGGAFLYTQLRVVARLRLRAFGRGLVWLASAPLALSGASGLGRWRRRVRPRSPFRPLFVVKRRRGRFGITFGVVLDLFAPAVAVGHGISRLGCHLSGDGCYGSPTDLPFPFAVSYANGVVPTAPGVLVHPTPVYEFFLLVGIGVLLWRWRLKNWPTYCLFGAYLVLNGIERFWIEFLRIEPRIVTVLGVPLTNAQVLGLASVAVGIALFVVARRHGSTPTFIEPTPAAEPSPSPPEAGATATGSDASAAEPVSPGATDGAGLHP